MEFKFKQGKKLEERKKEFQDIKKHYPAKIPIICEKAPNSRIKTIEKTKYLVEGGLSVPQFVSTIRKKLDMDDKEALFLLVNGKNTLSQNETIETVYNKYKDKDGFLYIAYASEEIWG